MNTLTQGGTSDNDNDARGDDKHRTQSYGDDMAADNVDYDGFNKNRNEEASYYGDDMKGDSFENYVETKGDNKEETASRRSNEKQNIQQQIATSNYDSDSYFKNLQEYRDYPNEAVESEAVEKKKKPFSSSSIDSMKDAIAIDSHLIDKELKTLNEEDRQIG